MQIREELEVLIRQGMQAAIDDVTLSMDTLPDPGLERPKDETNGDWASTVAMRSAKVAHRAPRDIAAAILDHLPENDLIESA